MENELPARLTFLITLILQSTIKWPISFTFCNSVQTSALSERAEPLRCVFLVGSQLECAENVQAQADKERKKKWREADMISGISKVLQYLAEERTTNKTNKNSFHASEEKNPNPRRKAIWSQWMPTALICKHLEVSFKQGVPHFTNLILSNTLHDL